MSPRILLLTSYFPPDLSAGSFRAAALVKAISETSESSAKVHVVTTMPNRYRSYQAEAEAHDRGSFITVTRIPIGVHASGKLDQAISFTAYVRGALAATSDNGYDLVVATSGRLLTAVLGAIVARRANCPLYLDIRDIFADNARYILPRPISWVLAPTFGAIEGWAVKRASIVNLVSGGFDSYFRRRYPKQRLSFYTNGVDDEFVRAQMRPHPPRSGRRWLRVLYAGNIGEGQALERIIPALAQRLQGEAEFELVGDGGRKVLLERALAGAGITNVHLRSPIPRDRIIDAYDSADVLFLHLNDYASLRNVLPSKVFEYAATGKPILAGVAGYPADFIRSEVPNAAVFEPCNPDSAVRQLRTLDLGHHPRLNFVAKFARTTVMRQMASDVLSLCRTAG